MATLAMLRCMRAAIREAQILQHLVDILSVVSRPDSLKLPTHEPNSSRRRSAQGCEEIADQNLPPAQIDRAKPTMLNLFADLKVFEFDGSPAYVRVGRQELLYGSERLISRLDTELARRRLHVQMVISVSEGLRASISECSAQTAAYSTVTLFARFRGLSTSQPRSRAMW